MCSQFSPLFEAVRLRLVASRWAADPCCPVDDYEAQTHHHEGDAQCSKTGGLRMRIEDTAGTGEL